MLSYKTIAMIDFGKPFKTLLTKAKGIVVQKNMVKEKHIIKCEILSKHQPRLQKSFIKNPKTIINLSCSEEDAKVIRHLYRISHIKLSKYAKFGLGIVTGNNKRFCINRSTKDHIPIYKGEDIQRGRINKPSIFIPNDLSLYQQVAPLDLFMAKEKIMYKFISSNLAFYYDTEQRIFLNSINMLVLNSDAPIRTKDLCHILNSRVVNWMFKSIFETHKVLKTDIASLPIHIDYFKKHSIFTEKSFFAYLGIKELANGTFTTS